MLRAKSKISHNNVEYLPGDILPSDLTSREMQALVDAGVAEVVVEQSKSDKKRVAVQKAVKGAKASTVRSPKPNLNWGKTRLLGEARKRGLKVDETMTPAELLAAIKKSPAAPDDEGKPEDVPATTRTSVEVPDVPEA